MKLITTFILLFLITTWSQAQISCIEEAYVYDEYCSTPVLKVFSFGRIKNNKREGEWKTYLDKKKRTLVGVVNYLNGTKNGHAKYWYPNGNIYKIAEFKNDKLNGFEVKFTEAGDFANTGYYKDEETKLIISSGTKPFGPFIYVATNSYSGVDYQFDSLQNYLKISKLP